MNNLPRWKTISRQDPEFMTYLDGRFSESHRALPVKSLNVDTAKEEVTFSIVPISEIQHPGWWTVAFWSSRPASWCLSLGPVLTCCLFASSLNFQLDSRLALSALAGIIFFHSGINFLDDYFDHCKGRDRVNVRGGSRVIQNGYVRARSMRNAGFGFVGLAILLGLPVVLASPSQIWLIALTTLAAGLGLSWERLNLKRRGLSEVTTFLIAGPLLTSGFSWAASGSWSADFFWLGIPFGFAAVLYYHLKNLENIMVDSQAGIRTLAVRLGFDRAKKFCFLLMGLASLSLLFFVIMVGRGFGPIIIFVLTFQLLAIIPVAHQLGRIISPLSSDLLELRRRGLRAHWLMTLILAALGTL